MDFFISNAMAADAGPAGGGLQLVFMVAIFFGIMYFMIIRPQRKRQKEHQAIIDNVGKGDEVVTNGGILGKVLKVDEHYMVIEVANNVELKLQKVALHAVLPKGTIKAI